MSTWNEAVYLGRDDMHQDNVLETEKMILSRDVGIDWAIGKIADETVVSYYVERAHKEGESAYEQYEDIPIFNWDNFDSCDDDYVSYSDKHYDY
jgi:hypothetical protein